MSYKIEVIDKPRAYEDIINTVLKIGPKQTVKITVTNGTPIQRVRCGVLGKIGGKNFSSTQIDLSSFLLFRK